MNTFLGIFKLGKLVFNISRIFGGEKKIYSEEEIRKAKERLIQAEADLKSGKIIKEDIAQNIDFYSRDIRILKNEPHPALDQNEQEKKVMSAELIKVLMNQFENEIAEIDKIENTMRDGELAVEKRQELVKYMHEFIDESIAVAIKKSPGRRQEFETSAQDYKNEVIEKIYSDYKSQGAGDHQYYKYWDILDAKEWLNLTETYIKAGKLDMEDIVLLSDIYEKNVRIINNQPHPAKSLNDQDQEVMPEEFVELLTKEVENEVAELNRIEKSMEGGYAIDNRKKIQKLMFNYIDKIIENEKNRTPDKIQELEEKSQAYKKEITEELFG